MSPKMKKAFKERLQKIRLKKSLEKKRTQEKKLTTYDNLEQEKNIDYVADQEKKTNNILDQKKTNTFDNNSKQNEETTPDVDLDQKKKKLQTIDNDNQSQKQPSEQNQQKNSNNNQIWDSNKSITNQKKSLDKNSNLNKINSDQKSMENQNSDQNKINSVLNNKVLDLFKNNTLINEQKSQKTNNSEIQSSDKNNSKQIISDNDPNPSWNINNAKPQTKNQINFINFQAKLGINFDENNELQEKIEIKQPPKKETIKQNNQKQKQLNDSIKMELWQCDNLLQKWSEEYFQNKQRGVLSTKTLYKQKKLFFCKKVCGKIIKFDQFDQIILPFFDKSILGRFMKVEFCNKTLEIYLGVNEREPIEQECASFNLYQYKLNDDNIYFARNFEYDLQQMITDAPNKTASDEQQEILNFEFQRVQDPHFYKRIKFNKQNRSNLLEGFLIYDYKYECITTNILAPPILRKIGLVFFNHFFFWAIIPEFLKKNYQFVSFLRLIQIYIGGSPHLFLKIKDFDVKRYFYNDDYEFDQLKMADVDSFKIKNPDEIRNRFEKNQ